METQHLTLMGEIADMFPQPFEGLTNFQLDELFQNQRQQVYNKQNNNSLLECLKNHVPPDLHDNANGVDCKYYDEDELNNATKNVIFDLSVYHVNIRKLGKHRGELSAYLSCLDVLFDVIVLSEIGDDAGNFVSSILKSHTCSFVLPANNKYGGVAIYVNSEHGVVERSDLNIDKSCSCEKCVYENLWLEI